MKSQHTMRQGKQRRLSIQLKIGAILLSVTTLVLSGFGYYQYHKFKTSQLANLHNLAQFALERLGENLIIPLWNYEKNQINKVLLAEMSDRSIVAIVVSNPQGSVIAGKAKSAQGEVSDLTDELPTNLISSQRDLVREDTPMGSVTISLTRQFMDAALHRELLDLAVAIIVLDVLLFLVLGVTVRAMLVQPINQFLRIGRAMTEGDLRQDITFRQSDEIGALANAFREMQAQIAAVVCNVKTAAQDVAQRSRELSAAAEQMSQGASQQASATEEASASIEEMTAHISQNATNAQHSAQIAAQAVHTARESEAAVTRTVAAMREIAGKIGMVTDICQQTRLLSLNATIEAARAQDYGRGFAVVAAEVRSLAERSQSAAAEITELTTASVTVAEQAGLMLQQLVSQISHTAELVAEISAASCEQHTGAEQINRAIQQLDQVTQHNAATAGELAATAENLTSQADILQKTMAFFTLNEVQPVIQPQEARGAGS